MFNLLIEHLSFFTFISSFNIYRCSFAHMSSYDGVAAPFSALSPRQPAAAGPPLSTSPPPFGGIATTAPSQPPSFPPQAPARAPPSLPSSRVPPNNYVSSGRTPARAVPPMRMGVPPVCVVELLFLVLTFHDFFLKKTGFARTTSNHFATFSTNQ